jgi:hypothetical protein
MTDHSSILRSAPRLIAWGNYDVSSTCKKYCASAVDQNIILSGLRAAKGSSQSKSYY